MVMNYFEICYSSGLFVLNSSPECIVKLNRICCVSSQDIPFWICWSKFVKVHRSWINLWVLKTGEIRFHHWQRLYTVTTVVVWGHVLFIISLDIVFLCSHLYPCYCQNYSLSFHKFFGLSCWLVDFTLWRLKSVCSNLEHLTFKGIYNILVLLKDSG